MSSDLPVGTIIGERYEVISFLGRGGFATVYEARHLHMQRSVAVKILNAGFEGPEAKIFEERFMLEATAAAQIEHPNVVTIHDFGFTGSQRQPYIVMQLLRGRNLKEEIATGGPMDPRRALVLFDACLEALGQGHAQGIIHKDLKPANLFLDSSGVDERLCIVDFGVARVETADVSRLTSTGQILGTPKYLAPEYLRDQIVTPSLDVYQMGLILTEMLVGSAVVDSSLPYTCILMHCTGELAIPVPLMESPIGPVLARALQIDHNERFHDANEFRAALAAVDPGAIPPVDSTTEATFIVGYGGPLARRSGAYPEMSAAVRQSWPSGEFVPIAASEADFTGEHAGSSRSTKWLVAGLAFAIVVLVLIAGGLFVAAFMGNDNAVAAHGEPDEPLAPVLEIEKDTAADRPAERVDEFPGRELLDAGRVRDKADAGGAVATVEDAATGGAVATVEDAARVVSKSKWRRSGKKNKRAPKAEPVPRKVPSKKANPTPERKMDKKKKAMGIAP